MNQLNQSVGFRASRRRLAGFFAALLGLWLLAFAAHVHAIDADDHPATVVHACGFCASLSTGAGPNTAVSAISYDGRHEAVEFDGLRSNPRPSPAHRYLSRAPPVR